MNKLVLAGMALVLAGFFLVFVGSILGMNGNTQTKAAGVLMIGPIPIVFGDKALLIPLIILVIVLMVLWFLLSHWD